MKFPWPGSCLAPAGPAGYDSLTPRVSLVERLRPVPFLVGNRKLAGISDMLTLWYDILWSLKDL